MRSSPSAPEFLGAPLTDYDVIFTSNTTEAINLAAESLSGESEQGIEPVVLNTLLEHNSNELPWRTVPGVSLIRLPVDAEGFVDLNELEALLRDYNQNGQHGKKRIKLVAVSGASNVLGVFNDLAAISRIAHRYGAHTCWWMRRNGPPTAKSRWNDAGLTISPSPPTRCTRHSAAERWWSERGCSTLAPPNWSGSQSSGEENVGGIAALGKALVLLQRIGLDVIQEEEQALTRRALRGLAQIPGLKIYGIEDPDSPRFPKKVASSSLA